MLACDITLGRHTVDAIEPKLTVLEKSSSLAANARERSIEPVSNARTAPAPRA